MGLLIIALNTAAATAQSVNSVKTLVYCPERGPETFNPQLTVHNSTFDASARLLYNRLVEMAPGTTRVVPGLAEAWEIADNGRVYTLRLRPEVAFHSNADFTPQRFFNADDVLFTFARQWRKNHPYHNVSGDYYEYFEGMGFSRTVLAVDKLDEQTVQFTLKQADASFLATLAMMFASILSAEYAEHLLRQGMPEQLDRRPLGTGPFRFMGYQTEQRLLYRAHEYYWNDRPALDQIILEITPAPEDRFAKLRRGACHVLPPTDAITAIRMQAWDKRRGIRILEKPALDIAYLAYNTSQPPFDDVRVRQALNRAVDRQAIIQVVYQNGGQLAEHALPPAIWRVLSAAVEATQDAQEPSGEDQAVPAEDIVLQAIPYDPAQARALLQEAGYPEGFKTEIWVLPVTRAYLPDPLKAAKLIRADWALLGVEAELVELNWEDFLSRSRAGEHQTILLGWVGDNGDANNFLTPLLSCVNVTGSNRARWCDSEFEDLLRQARIVTEPAKRALFYAKAMQRFQLESPWLPLAHSMQYQALRRAVVGFSMDPFGGSFFTGVDIK